MTPNEPAPSYRELLHRRFPNHIGPSDPNAPAPANDDQPSRLPKILGIIFPILLLLFALIFFGTRLWARHAMQASLPQVDGTLSVAGLSAPVTVLRDNHGVPHIRAASLDDLIVAQGYVTAQDRLWQMDAIRRHGSGELAEILGSRFVPHDRTQRTLQLSAAAVRVVAALPPDQLHWLNLYARGVNASIAAQQPHLPLEFRLLHYSPAPWTPRDSVLVGLVMFEDLTNTFPVKLGREAISTRLPPALVADLYPVGSWRDHPPSETIPDLTAPQPPAPEVPLDKSQSSLRKDTHGETAVSTGAAQPHPAAQRKDPRFSPFPHLTATALEQATRNILALQQDLSLFGNLSICDSCRAGSNEWVVSGVRTASGKPLLSNDPHLNLSVPGIWYQSDLSAPGPGGATFHVAGVALPGTPFIVLGHNDHVAWGFTNLGADVQEVYVERTRGSGASAEFQSPDLAWHPVLRTHEIIRVRGARDVSLELLSTVHGGTPTPIISPLLPAISPTGKVDTTTSDRRALSLRWTVYDPAVLKSTFYAINAAADSASLLAALSNYSGPAQNVVYADDQGHIGYHAVGLVPVRGSLAAPTPISPLPVLGTDPAYDWAGYIPFDQLPQVVDPPSGILATANSRVTPPAYPFPITLDWAPPYRNERIWKVLAASHSLTPANMLTLQTDVYSAVDQTLAQRFAYAIDHAGPHTSANPARLRQAADLLRTWDGKVEITSSAAAIVDAARTALWPMLLVPRLGPAWQIYSWGEKDFAEEQLIMNGPARWLPAKGASWNDLLAAAVDKGLTASHAPADLASWQYGKDHVLDLEHPIFSLSPLLQSVLGVRTGTGILPQSGDSTTVKQVGRTFGPSERFTADFSNFDNSTLNLVLGQSGDPLSPWFMDQFPAWYNGTTFTIPFSTPSIQKTTNYTLILTPK